MTHWTAPIPLVTFVAFAMGGLDKGSLCSRLALRALNDRLAYLSQTMSPGRSDGGPG